MRLTEARLKQLINDEYQNILLEASLSSALPPIDIKDLIPKAKEMKATKGEEDVLQEAGGLLLFAAALAFPKVLQWMGKAAKTFLSQEKVYKFIADKVGVIGKLQLDEMVQLLTSDLGNFIHSAYLNIIRYSVVKPIKLLAKLGGEEMPKEQEDEITEILFIMLLVCVAIAGVSMGLGTITAGKAAGHGLELTIEAITTAIKAFETTEYAGVVPAALKFLETASKHH
tara:strand:- start:410 stop:1090 length:681 start_codon:yes stop_codon:yes gene_type:complete